MNWKTEWKSAVLILAAFLACYHLPVGLPRFDNAITEAFQLVKWYAQEHVMLCLVPAFFIAGAIAVFVSEASVMKYLGAKANVFLAYGVASVSGTILAVCSCTVLPLFAGIYRMGAGLGPAIAFLYSGPAINVLAIIMTARILGLEMGIARTVGAVSFSLIIGALMHLIYRREEQAKVDAAPLASPEATRPLWQTALYFAAMSFILIFANWAKPATEGGLWSLIFGLKWPLTALSAMGLAVMLHLWFGLSWLRLAGLALPVVASALLFPTEPLYAFITGALMLSLATATGNSESKAWFAASWDYAKQILPLLLAGVFVAGALLGRVGHEGLIPADWIAGAVGGNSLMSNFVAAFAGAFMYFATLTEVPIIQGLMASGMGKGPALALLLAGPALSLPSMLVIRTVIGTKKTVVFSALVIVMATISGFVYGQFF